MKTVLIAVLTAAIAGCGVELLTTTAIQSELQAQQLQAVKGQVQHASDTTAKINIQRAIDTYQAEKGQLPASLDELVPGFLPSLPTRPDGSPYGYDATTGKVLDGPASPAAAGPTAADRQKMQQIQEAINGYGTATGYYPPSLSVLAPTYIAAVPKTDSGLDFVYSPQTGALMHPAQAASPRGLQARPAAPMGGGAGPMGEVMTGIGMQNQLNSMNQGGTSSAGGYARQSLGGVTEQHNQQQEQALKALGY